MRARSVPMFATLAAMLLAAGCTSANAAPQAQPQPKTQGQTQSSSASESAASSPSATSLPTCKAPEPAVLPHAAGSLTEADSGAYCLGVGQILDVFLTAPSNAAPGARWAEIGVGDVSVVRYGNSGVLTPPLGVTPGVFVGGHPGATTLSSSLPNGTAWKVTIVVK